SPLSGRRKLSSTPSFSAASLAPFSQMVQKSSGLLVTIAILILPESRLHDGNKAKAKTAAARIKVRRERDIGVSRRWGEVLPTRYAKRVRRQAVVIHQRRTGLRKLPGGRGHTEVQVYWQLAGPVEGPGPPGSLRGPVRRCPR